VDTTKRYLTEGLCDAGDLSIGLIEPSGRYKELEDKDGGHNAYAEDYLVGRGDEDIILSTLGGGSLKDYFAQKYKYILVSNAYNMFGPDPNSVKGEQWNALLGGVSSILSQCGELPSDSYQKWIYYAYKDGAGKSQVIKDRNIKRFMTAMRQKKNLVQPRIDYTQLIQEAAMSHDQIQKDFTAGLDELLKLLQASEEQAQQNPTAANAYLGVAMQRRQQLATLLQHLDTKAAEAQKAVKGASQGKARAMSEGIKIKITQLRTRKSK